MSELAFPFFLDMTQRHWVIDFQRFETTQKPHFQGPKCAERETVTPQNIVYLYGHETAMPDIPEEHFTKNSKLHF
jgi:hypothetical protein